MFNLEPCELRRIKYDLVPMYKISSDVTDVSHDKISLFQNTFKIYLI